MRNFFIALAIFILWSIFGLWLYSWFQPKQIQARNENNSTQRTSVINAVKDATHLIDSTHAADKVLNNNNLGLRAKGLNELVIFEKQEGIFIYKNSSKIKIPQSNSDFTYHLLNYYNQNKNTELHILAVYAPVENIIIPNMGIQRGNMVRDLLLDAGFPSENIVVKSIIKELHFDEENKMANGISFEFKKFDENRTPVTIEPKTNTKIVYPTFTDTGIIANSGVKNLKTEIIAMFGQYPNCTVEIIGHTDNIGNAQDNYNIGITLAQQLRGYLIANKIPRGQIIVSSKGESMPIDDNNTQQGRIKNKRLEIKYHF